MCVWSSFEEHGAGAALKLCVYEQVRAFVFINTSFLKQKNNTHFILCFLISAPPTLQGVYLRFPPPEQTAYRTH